MPTQERMPAALVCRQEDVDAEEAATVDVEDPFAMREMRYASWMLGQQFGFAVSHGQRGRGGPADGNAPRGSADVGRDATSADAHPSRVPAPCEPAERFHRPSRRPIRNASLPG